MKLDEQEMEEEFALKSSDDLFFVEKVYDTHVQKIYQACEEIEEIKDKLNLVKAFCLYCLKDSKIKNPLDYCHYFNKTWTRTLEVQFSVSKTDDFFRLPTNDKVNDIKILTSTYPILYEKILGDSIYPYLNLKINSDEIPTKGDMINQIKKINNGQFRDIVKYLINTIRNACYHNSVRYYQKKDLVIFHDPISKRDFRLSGEKFLNYTKHIFFFDMAFIYTKYKMEEPLDRNLIKGVKVLKKYFPNIKLVPSTIDKMTDKSMGEILLFLSMADENEIRKKLSKDNK